MASALAFVLMMLDGNGHGGVLGHPNPSEDAYQKAFVDFARRFEKHYDVSEFFSRYNAFKTSFDFIEQHNAANFSYTVGINEFADLTNDEFIATHTGYKRLSGARRVRGTCQQDISSTLSDLEATMGTLTITTQDCGKSGDTTACVNDVASLLGDAGTVIGQVNAALGDCGFATSSPCAADIAKAAQDASAAMTAVNTAATDCKAKKIIQCFKDVAASVKALRAVGADVKQAVADCKKGSAMGATTAPDSVDWTTKGVVTPIKNQGQCGSCWAFSTTGSLEGAFAIANKQLQSFSEQQLVDCAGSFGNQGCNGGEMDDAFKYVEKNGLCLEMDYPYKGTDGTCQASKRVPAVRISGYTDVASKDLDALESAAAGRPISVAVDAAGLGWQLYKGGVYSGGLFGACGTALDHGVLVVGYDRSGGYWKVKNSWGATWGEKGYIRLKKSTGKGAGTCGLAMEPSYPTISS